MTIRALRGELSKLRQQVDKAVPAPKCDLFERIEQYATVLGLLRAGQPIPPELAEVAERAKEYDEMLGDWRGETDEDE